jgi:hypothetical protein
MVFDMGILPSIYTSGAKRGPIETFTFGCGGVCKQVFGPNERVESTPDVAMIGRHGPVLRIVVRVVRDEGHAGLSEIEHLSTVHNFPKPRPRERLSPCT